LKVLDRLRLTENTILEQIRELNPEQDKILIQTLREAITEIENEIQRLGGKKDWPNDDDMSCGP
jgi:hypothetical protein